MTVLRSDLVEPRLGDVERGTEAEEGVAVHGARYGKMGATA